MKFLQTVSCLFYINTLIAVREGQNEKKGVLEGPHSAATTLLATMIQLSRDCFIDGMSFSVDCVNVSSYKTKF